MRAARGQGPPSPDTRRIPLTGSPVNPAARRAAVRGSREILGAEGARGERLAAFCGGVAAVHMLVDIGGGEVPGTLDFFTLSDEGIVVVSPNPASMQGAYRFIKRAVYRRVEGELGAGARARLSHFQKTATSPDASTLDDFLGLLRKTDPELSEAAAAARR